MRRLLAIALLLVPALAFAQSDTRKVAIFTFNKDANGALSSPVQAATTTDAAYSTDAYLTVMLALERMGVPYTVFNAADSVGGWRSTMGAARPAGMADSTWFRQNGYFMTYFALPGVGSSTTQIAVKAFQDGRTRGTYFQSPLSGRWGIPCLVHTYQAANSAGVPFYNGTAVGTTGLPQAWQSYFANGDSTSTEAAFTILFVRQPFQADSVTNIISVGDTSINAGGSRMRAWRWNNNAYYFATQGTYAQATWTLLGLAEVFRAAGYAPRRKLNLHMTLDHLYAEGATDYTAPSDSFLTYARFNKWRPVIALKAHGAGSASSEYANAGSATKTIMNRWVNDFRLPVTPHSHVVGVGNWFQSASWNFSTFADTSTKRARWNDLEEAIADTLGLPLARGYEKTAGLPGDGITYKDLYILAQNDYKNVRVLATDSIGVRPGVDLYAANAVYVGAATGPRYLNLPWPWTDPSSGKRIWVHGIASYPGDDDTTWTTMSNRAGNHSVHAYTMSLTEAVARAILYDADYYWHPNYNLQQAAVTTDRPMVLYARRLTYFLGRLSNIVTVDASYRPQYPRRSSIAR